MVLIIKKLVVLYMDANDSLFWSGFYTFLGGFLLGFVSLLYKSKCKNVKLCGICEIQRDIEAEIQEQIHERQHTHSSLDRPITT